MSRKPVGESTRPRHGSLAVVFQVRERRLQALLWQRARDPFRGAWALPGGILSPGETLEESIRRHLAAKVDVREVSHIEQLATYSDPGRDPRGWELATAYLGLVQLGLDPDVPGRHAAGIRSTSCRRPRSTTARSCSPARERLRGKLSYSNAGFALAPPTFTLAELREVYVAALGHDVSATNLRRVLERRAVIEPTGERRPSGRAGGRPAEVFRFRDAQLAITDPFAALRPRRR